MTNQKRGKRKRRRFRLRLILVIALFFLLVASGLSIWVIFFTDVFRVREVKVSGVNHLESEYVRQLSGVDGYDNLITLPVRKLEKNLLQEPWIKEVIISRKIFGTVSIKVKERIPIAVLDLDGDVYLLDGEGYAINRDPESKMIDLPRISWISALPPEEGIRVNDEKIQGALKILSRLPAGLKSLINYADPFNKKGNVLKTKEGIEIYYGKADRLSDKNIALETIFQDIRERKIEVEYVDVRVPENPVIKEKISRKKV